MFQVPGFFQLLTADSWLLAPNFHLLVGYAGWGAGQLASEVAQGAWLPASANAPLLFEDELGTLWKRAYADAIGTVPGAFVSTTRGSA